MAVEAAGVERERDPGCERQLADLQLRACRARALEPRRHLGRRGGAHLGVVERGPVALQHRPRAARVSDGDLRMRARQVELRPFAHVHLEREHLPEPALAEHDVAAQPQLQVVQRSLQAEPAPVDRRGQGQDGGLELAACGTEPLEAFRPEAHAQVWTAPGRVSAQMIQTSIAITSSDQNG